MKTLASIFGSLKCIFPKCTFSGLQLSLRGLVWYLLIRQKPMLRAGLISPFLYKIEVDFKLCCCSLLSLGVRYLGLLDKRRLQCNVCHGCEQLSVLTMDVTIQLPLNA